MDKKTVSLVGHFLAQLRSRRSLSQRDFAKLTGINPSTLAMIECGSRRVSSQGAKKILKLLTNVGERWEFFNAWAGHDATLDDDLFNIADVRPFLQSLAFTSQTVSQEELLWLIEKQKDFKFVMKSESTSMLIGEYRRGKS